MCDFGDPDSAFTLAPSEAAQRVHQELSNECGFEYDLNRSQLYWCTLSFYGEGTSLCRLELEPQVVRTRRRRPELKVPTSYYFLFRPSDQSVPVMPLGNDADWVLRANKYYGLILRKRAKKNEDELSFAEVTDVEDPTMLRRIIEYLHFYYSFTRYDAYMGGPMRFRVPRTLADMRFSNAAEEDRCQAMGALWRFLDRRGTGQITPAIGTVVRFINRCHADVPIQVASSLWRLRVSIRLRSGYVRLYGRVPFFHSPHLVPPPAAEVRVLPAPRGVFWWEPWLLLPTRVRAGVGALTYFAAATSWLLAVVVSLSFPLTYLFHPTLVAYMRNFFGPLVPVGWNGLWGISAYSILVFALLSAFVFQFDTVLSRAARTAPGLLRGAYYALDRLQKYAWDWFRPRLESPTRKAGTAMLWLLASSVFLILSFTTLQVSQEPGKFGDDLRGLEVLQTFIGHATIAFPGVPYLLGAIGFDPLNWLKDPDMTSATVLGFRVMMLIVVVRAFWKLLGYTSPRVLSRDNRRLEHEIAKLNTQPRRRVARAAE